MTRDPLFRRIVEQLSCCDDPTTFQLCANDLLRQDYPTLAPLIGGNDAGFDGAIGTDAGAFPVIATTSDNVLDNVRRNLSEYRSREVGPLKAVVATTRLLSPLRRRNITAAAADLQVTIVNIHDGADFANRLYRNSRWRKELLGLSGDPPALSVFPPRGRSQPTSLLIGRETELTRIRDHAGDLLVVGQPGSGKTYLHQQLAIEGKCLFLNSDDLGNVAECLRDSSPSVVVVDDAHLKSLILSKLVRLRKELDAPFQIHANCWPSGESNCRSLLELGESDIVRLELLTREQILGVIKACGLHGPDDLLHLLLNQAEGKPGLAAALADASRRGDVKRVWTGESLADFLLSGRQIAATEKEKTVLAAFSVGGAIGMSMQSVADAVQLSLIAIRQIVTNLGAGGVIDEGGHDRLAVHPAELRSLLVRQIFYDGAKSIPIDGIWSGVASPVETARVLLGARQRGANVSIQTIEMLIGDSDDRELWEHFAWVDPACAKHILQSFPHRAADAAPGLLFHEPAAAIAQLLNLGCSEQCPASSAIEYPRRRISEWLCGAKPLDGSHFDRRQHLLKKVQSWKHTGSPKELDTLGWALAKVIESDFEGIRQPPGSGLEFSVFRGTFPTEQLRQIFTLWPSVLEFVSKVAKPAWKHLLTEVEKWCRPIGPHRIQNLEAGELDFLIEAGTEMLCGLMELPSPNRAILSWAYHISSNEQLKIEIEPDADFETLFGDTFRSEDWQAADERRYHDSITLIEKLNKTEVKTAITYLRDIELESIELGVATGGWWRLGFYRRLANTVSNPQVWFDSLVQEQFPPEFVLGFGKAAIARDSRQGAVTIKSLFDHPQYGILAIELALCLSPFDESIASEAINRLKGQSTISHHWLASLGSPLETRQRLLEHEDRRIRASAAISEWIRCDNHPIPLELEASWRNAVLEVERQDEFQLQRILESDTNLAFEWICKQLLPSEGWYTCSYGSLFANLSTKLSHEQRLALLNLITYETFSSDCFDGIVGGDLLAFSAWFSKCNDERLRTLSLRRGPSQRWIDFALIALQHGFSETILAETCVQLDGSWTGPASKYYDELRAEYEKILIHPDVRLHDAARRGIAVAVDQAAYERRAERDEAVLGIGTARRRRRLKNETIL